MQTLTATLAVLAASFGVNSEQPLHPQPPLSSLHKINEQDFMNSLNLSFSPIDKYEIQKIEKEALISMGTTKCCASGTCMDIDWNILPDHILSQICREPWGPPCP